jgi:hypothetical protein
MTRFQHLVEAGAAPVAVKQIAHSVILAAPRYVPVSRPRRFI